MHPEHETVLRRYWRRTHGVGYDPEMDRLIMLSLLCDEFHTTPRAMARDIGLDSSPDDAIHIMWMRWFDRDVKRYEDASVKDRLSLSDSPNIQLLLRLEHDQ